MCMCACVYVCVVLCLRSRLLRIVGSSRIKDGGSCHDLPHIWSPQLLPFASQSSSFPFYVGFHVPVMFLAPHVILSLWRGVGFRSRMGHLLVRTLVKM
uniref:Putative secreted peptide n=1 Tax=Anopheles braziliensis TaxID=58242 RepID=A0A2M3ZQY4_9DIPT